MRMRLARASSSSGSGLSSACSARVRSSLRLSSSWLRNVSTRARDRRAALSSKLGFSVVAPTRMTVPSSITGRKLSCWARLKRWISSTKSSVWRPSMRRRRAVSKTFFKSATPEKIADICSNASPASPDSSRATVVLPVPGGPQKIIEPSEPLSIMRRSAPSSPVRCGWPVTSASDFGRRRSASGRRLATSSGTFGAKRSPLIGRTAGCAGRHVRSRPSRSPDRRRAWFPCPWCW